MLVISSSSLFPLNGFISTFYHLDPDPRLPCGSWSETLIMRCTNVLCRMAPCSVAWAARRRRPRTEPLSRWSGDSTSGDYKEVPYIHMITAPLSSGNIFLNRYKKITSPEEIFSQLSLWMVNLSLCIQYLLPLYRYLPVLVWIYKGPIWIRFHNNG